MIQRKPAHKLWISELEGGQLQKEPGEFGSHYLSVKDKNVSRVNLIATVVDVFVKPESNFASISLDDGSGTINVKAFKEDSTMLMEFLVGDLVMVLGRIREYNDERYILPEVVKKTDANWELLRKIELFKEYGRPKKQAFISRENDLVQVSTEQGEVVQEVDSVSSELRNKILNYVEKADDDGADHGKILEALSLTDEEADAVLKELLSEGEIYQSRPGKYKVI
jgi:uncharacterized protein